MRLYIISLGVDTQHQINTQTEDWHAAPHYPDKKNRMRDERLEQLQTRLRMKSGHLHQRNKKCDPGQSGNDTSSPARSRITAQNSLPLTPRGVMKLAPLPARSTSLPSKRASSESAPAVDDSARVAESYVPSVPWWHMPGDETEKCSMCKIIGMKVPCRCMPVAMPLLTAREAWGVMGRRFKAVHSEEAPALNQAPTRRATDALRTSQPDCNILPSSPFPLRIAPLLLEHRPSTARQIAAERQTRRLRPGAHPQLPASPFRDRFQTTKSRTRSDPVDYVRPVIGRSRVLVRLPQPASV